MLVELDANRAMYAKDRRSSMPCVPMCCCRISTPNMRRGWCGSDLAYGDSRTAASASSMRSIIRLLRNYGSALADFTADRFVILRTGRPQ